MLHAVRSLRDQRIKHFAPTFVPDHAWTTETKEVYFCTTFINTTFVNAHQTSIDDIQHVATCLDIENKVVKRPRGHSVVKNTRGGGGWLDSLLSGILVGKRYFGVLQKY